MRLPWHALTSQGSRPGTPLRSHPAAHRRRCGDARVIRALEKRAGFREVRVRANVKLSRWQSAEHMVRSVVSSGPTMLGGLAAQGPDVLDAIVAEVTNATRDYVDDEGRAACQATNIIRAVV